MTDTSELMVIKDNTKFISKIKTNQIILHNRIQHARFQMNFYLNGLIFTPYYKNTSDSTNEILWK